MNADAPHDTDVLSPTTICVVTAEPSAALDATLRRRGWQVIVRRDPLLAMAEICLQHRAQRARAGWGGGRPEQLAVLAVPTTPGAASGIHEDLLAAVRRYLPDVSCWLAGEAELVPVDASVPPRPPGSAPDAEARPRGTGDDLAVLDRAGAAEGRDGDDDPLRISPEELDMLFGEGGEARP